MTPIQETLNWIKKYREFNGGDYPNPDEIEAQLEMQKEKEKELIFETAEDSAFHMYEKVVESLEDNTFTEFNGKKTFESYYNQKHNQN
jgi:hypothetical protein